MMMIMQILTGSTLSSDARSLVDHRPVWIRRHAVTTKPKNRNEKAKKHRKNQTHHISAKEIEEANSGLKTWRDQMKFLTALTPKEREAAPRMTPARLALMEIALQGARDNPGAILVGMDLASYENDVR